MSKELVKQAISGDVQALNKLINNPVLLSSQEFLSLYLSYFSPRHMFILGDYGPRSSFPNLSTFFLWQFPFYILGLYSIFKKKDMGEIRYLTIFLLIISPIPAAVTRDPYSSIRALHMVIPQTILIAIGIIEFGKIFKRKILTGLYSTSIAILTVYSVAHLYSSVIILNEFYRAKFWNYGWEQVADALQKLDKKLPVVVDNARDEPYIQLLFFTKYDPASYQRENYEVPISQYYTNMERVKTKKIGNITTRPINWKNDLPIEQILVGDELAISLQQIEVHNLSLLDEIRFPDGSIAFRIVKTNPI